MSKCNRCNIDILDDALVCPLCRGVLQLTHNVEIDGLHADNHQGEAESTSVEVDEIGMDEIEMYESKSRMYPDIKPVTKKIKLVIKLFIFISVLVEAVLILINYLTYNGVKWSLICGAALIYLCFTVCYSVPKNAGHKSKMFAQMIGAIILVVLIDCALGYTGWSLNYVTPIAIMLFDVTILVFMIINSNNWQNYILLQVAMLIVSIIFAILAAVDVVKWGLLTIIAAFVSAVLLIGTVVFGDKTAITELSRRFRV
ncbi:MAG: hypothetical protein E7257_04610 [Lachnospiraceae bacterium]|nr:hypothetical protein [Lachnospiraceae bacterium]